MTVLSCLNYKTIPTSCIEYGHPWTDSCRDASIGLFFQAFKYSLRTYATVYLFTALMRRKKPSKTVILQTISAILQSTAFLTTHAYGFSACLCTLRRLTGRFDKLSVSFTPAFLSSLVAIHIERPSRRPILCLYVTNIASETLFRMAVERGWVKPIKHGEIIIFALSMTSLLYRFRGDHNNDSMLSLLRFVLGKEEERLCVAPEASTSELPQMPSSSRSPSSSSSKRHPVSLPIIFKAFEVYKYIVNALKSRYKSACCPHDHSCLFYTLKGGAKMLATGYGIQVLLRTVLSLGKIYKKPSQFPKLFYSSNVLNLGAFLGLFTSTFRGSSCLLRYLRGSDSQVHAVPAGLLASLAFWFYPDTTIALYVMWKALQMFYGQLIENGYIPHVPGDLVLLYSFGVSVIFHAALLEPNNLRPAYSKFLNSITGGRFVTMSRVAVKPFSEAAADNLSAVIHALKLKVLYVELTDAGYLPSIPFGTVLLYAFSTSVLFHGCFVEPNCLRPSYLKFLDGLSGGRVIAMDRIPIDRFGHETSKHLAKMVEHLKINPNPRYTFSLFGNIYPDIVSL